MNFLDNFNTPPAVLLLLSVADEVGLNDPLEIRRAIKDLLPELERQSIEFSLNRFDLMNSSAGVLNNFSIHVNAGLDIFNPWGGCANLKCRISAAERLLKSLGLFADEIWLTDHLTDKLCDFGEVTEQKLNYLVNDLIVLKAISSYISCGIIKFKSAWYPTCSGCIGHFEDAVDEISRKIYPNFSEKFGLEAMGNRRFAVHTGGLYDPPNVQYVRKPHGKRRTRIDWDAEYFSIFRQAVRSALWDGRDASKSHGSVFSNSLAGISGVVHQSGRLGPDGNLRVLEESRSLKLPWVNDLTVAQTLELRQEANKSLPLFREKINSILVGAESSSVADAVSALRYDAEELRQELSALSKKSSMYWKNSFTVLGLGIAAVSLAMDQPLGAAAGLLPLLEFIENHKSGHAAGVNKLKAQPGYVLVKARDILEHSH